MRMWLICAALSFGQDHAADCCRDMMHTMEVKICQVCGKEGAQCKLCPACAKARGECSHCRQKPKGAAEEIKPSKEWSGACRGDATRIGGREFVRVTSAEDWARLWKRHTGDDKSQPPEVDFAKEMVVACFFGKCGWTQSAHETGYAFRSAKLEPKELVLRVDVSVTGQEYGCSGPVGFWIGVFPKRAGPVQIVAVIDPKGRNRDESVGRIE